MLARVVRTAAAVATVGALGTAVAVSRQPKDKAPTPTASPAPAKTPAPIAPPPSLHHADLKHPHPLTRTEADALEAAGIPTNTPASKTRRTPLSITVAAASCGGIAELLATGSPFNNLQTLRLLEKYRTLSMPQIVKKEGISVLYRGLPIQLLLRPAYISAIKASQHAVEHLHDSLYKDNRPMTPQWKLASAFFAGVGGSAFSTISELVNTMQLLDKKVSAWTTLRSQYKRIGVSGLLVGVGPILGREIPYGAAAAVLGPEVGKRLPIQNSTLQHYVPFLDPQTTRNALGGAIAGLGAATITQPFNRIKTILQELSRTNPEPWKRNFLLAELKESLKAFNKIVKEEGPLALLKGLGWRAGRIGAGLAIIVPVIEEAKALLSSLDS